MPFIKQVLSGWGVVVSSEEANMGPLLGANIQTFFVGILVVILHRIERTGRTSEISRKERSFRTKCDLMLKIDIDQTCAHEDKP